jgi:hypothetical protein
VKSGVYGLKRALFAGGLGVVDGRSQAGRAVAADRAALVEHLGGAATATQERLVESVLTLDLLIAAGVAAVAEWGPVNRRSRTYRRVALDLASLLGQRARLMETLGLERRVRVVSPHETVRLAVAAAVAGQDRAGDENAAPLDREDPGEPSAALEGKEGAA